MIKALALTRPLFNGIIKNMFFHFFKTLKRGGFTMRDPFGVADRMENAILERVDRQRKNNFKYQTQSGGNRDGILCWTAAGLAVPKFFCRSDISAKNVGAESRIKQPAITAKSISSTDSTSNENYQINFDFDHQLSDSPKFESLKLVRRNRYYQIDGGARIPVSRRPKNRGHEKKPRHIYGSLKTAFEKILAGDEKTLRQLGEPVTFN